MPEHGQEDRLRGLVWELFDAYNSERDAADSQFIASKEGQDRSDAQAAEWASRITAVFGGRP